MNEQRLFLKPFSDKRPNTNGKSEKIGKKVNV